MTHFTSAWARSRKGVVKILGPVRAEGFLYIGVERPLLWQNVVSFRKGPNPTLSALPVSDDQKCMQSEYLSYFIVITNDTDNSRSLYYSSSFHSSFKSHSNM